MNESNYMPDNRNVPDPFSSTKGNLYDESYAINRDSSFMKNRSQSDTGT